MLEEFDPRPGGPFRMTLLFGDGDATKGKTSAKSDSVDGRFVDLVPPQLIEQEFSFVSADPQFAGTMTMTWTLAKVGEGTLVEVTARNVPDGITPEQHRIGMSSSLTNLAAFVETETNHCWRKE
jgi:uncharacterized protein YndB with AHSA1/START domain